MDCGEAPAGVVGAGVVRYFGGLPLGRLAGVPVAGAVGIGG